MGEKNFYHKYHVRSMISFFMEYKKYYLISVFLTLISSSIFYLTPLINILIFDEGIKKNNLKILILSVLLMIVANLLIEAFKILQVKYDLFLDYKISRRLKTKVLNYCIDNSFISDKSGEFVSLVERDTSAYINVAYNGTISIIKNVINVISSTVIIVKLQPDLALISIVLQSMLIIIRLKTQKIEEMKGKALRDSYVKLYSSINEIVDNIQKISILGASKYASRRYENALDNEFKVSKSQAIFRNKIDSLISLTMVLIYGITLVWGGYKVALGTMTVGALISFNQYTSSLSSPLIGLISIPSSFASNYDAINKISTILEKNDDLDNKYESDVSEIKVSKLYFSYDSEMIFNNVRANFKKGNVYYICGPSGTGKSTLIKLLSGQLRNYKGTININGLDLKKINSKNMSDLIAVVTQETILFNDSIINNIVLDSDIDFEKVKYLCKICNIFDDIEALPDKFNTILSEKGEGFSGGQKSRLCLARALYKNLPVIIMDEVTAGLDGITERSIRDNLAKALSDKIVIIVTHSRNFIMDKSIIYNINDHKLKREDPECLK